MGKLKQLPFPLNTGLNQQAIMQRLHSTGSTQGDSVHVNFDFINVFMTLQGRLHSAEPGHISEKSSLSLFPI